MKTRHIATCLKACDPIIQDSVLLARDIRNYRLDAIEAMLERASERLGKYVELEK